ncbi:MAG: thioredoxin fold domain-containing protein [Planctomycetes bacterium]|nr:thioredoxin fold domain-containing protein [Planctomycetota bacterium]
MAQPGPNGDPHHPHKSSGSRAILVLLGLIVAFAVVTGLIESRGTTPVDAVGWHHSYGSAVDQARVEGKPILVYFTADWCAPCSQMKREVFSQPDVGMFIRTHAVPLMLSLSSPDAQTARLVERLRIEALPAFVIINADGEEIARTAGYLPEHVLLPWLSGVPGQRTADAE